MTANIIRAKLAPCPRPAPRPMVNCYPMRKI